MKTAGVIKTLFAATLLLPLASRAAEAGMAKITLLACKDEAVLRNVAKLRAKGDAKASADFEAASKSSGNCLMIPKSAPVSIDERKAPLFCIRPNGALDCYWAVSAAVDEYGAPPKAAGGPVSMGGGGKRRR